MVGGNEFPIHCELTGERSHGRVDRRGILCAEHDSQEELPGFPIIELARLVDVSPACEKRAGDCMDDARLIGATEC